MYLLRSRSMSMDKKNSDDNDLDYSIVQRISSMDSLEETDAISSITDSLRCINGRYNWVSLEEKHRVKKNIEGRCNRLFDQQIGTVITGIGQLYEIDDDDEFSIRNKSSSTSTDFLLQGKLSEIDNDNDDDDDDDSFDQSSLNALDLSISNIDFQFEPEHFYNRFRSLPSNLKKTGGFLFNDEFDRTLSISVSEDDHGEYQHGSDRSPRRSNNNYPSSNNGNNTFSRSDHQSNSSRSSNNDGNETNSNQNNNNARRSNDGKGDDDDNNDDDDDDDDDENDDDDDPNDNADENEDEDDSDENLARRLGFVPLTDETIQLISRIRNLTRKKFFDRRDFETLQYLIDELIQNRQLEDFSRDQAKEMISILKIDRPFRSSTRALNFVQERIPRRAVKYQIIASDNPTSENVFNIWRERERRARLDSKDSLEDDPSTLNGRNLRDVMEISNPTPPVIISNMTVSLNPTGNNYSKVRQMAKEIDTKSVTKNEIFLRTNENSTDVSPANYSSSVSVALYAVKSPNQDTGFHSESGSEGREKTAPSSNSSITTNVEQNRVRKMISSLESSFSSNVSPSTRTSKIQSRKSVQDDRSDGSAGFVASPTFKRIDSIDSENSVFHRFQTQKSDDHQSRVHRTPSGTTIEEYVTPLSAETQTSLSMVREVRASVRDEEPMAHSKVEPGQAPVQVDVETLYIVEQKSERNPSHSSMINVFIPDVQRHSSPSPTREQHDFAAQTTPTPLKKPIHRPIGIQVESRVSQQTSSAQTTDSLHRPRDERPRLQSPTSNSRKKCEVKVNLANRQRSEEDDGATVVLIDDKPEQMDCQVDVQFDSEKDKSTSINGDNESSFGRITARIRHDILCDINRVVVNRHVPEATRSEHQEYRSNEVYEIHSRGIYKCLVVSHEEQTQIGLQTRSEKELERIENAYSEEDLKVTELHVIVSSSDPKYELVRRDYAEPTSSESSGGTKQGTLKIHYYDENGRRMRTERNRILQHLPLFIRCEIEYELYHYGSAKLIILAVTNAERRQAMIHAKENMVNEIIVKSNGRLKLESDELEAEFRRQLTEQINLTHLVDYSSRDDYRQPTSTDIRPVSRVDVATSLRVVQSFRPIIHRLCQNHRSHLRLTPQVEQQRLLILVAHEEYYLLDLSEPIQSAMSNIRQRQHDIFEREVNNVLQKPFDFSKYRRENEQHQQRLLEQHLREREKHQHLPKNPPPTGHPSEAEFYLGSQRRQQIERQVHSIRRSIRDHENAPVNCRNSGLHRSSTVSYSGGQRFIRARIIHVKDFYDGNKQDESRSNKEQELFVRVDDYINESTARSLRRSYSTDYLSEGGPRSRIRYIRIPGERNHVEDKPSDKNHGVMNELSSYFPFRKHHFQLPICDDKFLNIDVAMYVSDQSKEIHHFRTASYILDREARQGRPLGSSLPQVILNDPYKQVIPPLTQKEIHQTAQQILAPGYSVRSYTDQNLRWFLSRDSRTEIESSKYLQTLDQYRPQHDDTHLSYLKPPTIPTLNTMNNTFRKESTIQRERSSDHIVPGPKNHQNFNKNPTQTRSPSFPRTVHTSVENPRYLSARSQSQPRANTSMNVPSSRSAIQSPRNRTPLPCNNAPLSRHQSVHEITFRNGVSHPASPSPSVYSLHSQQPSYYYQQQHHTHHRRPVSFNNRSSTVKQTPAFTEIIDSQTGRRIMTTSQEQLPTEVLGLLNKYNLQKI